MHPSPTVRLAHAVRPLAVPALLIALGGASASARAGGTTYDWLNASGGDWYGDNWSQSGEPGALDTARFALNSSGYTVTLSEPTSLGRLLAPQDVVLFDLLDNSLFILQELGDALEVGSVVGTTVSTVTLTNGDVNAGAVAVGFGSTLSVAGPNVSLSATSIDMAPEIITVQVVAKGATAPRGGSTTLENLGTAVTFAQVIRAWDSARILTTNVRLLDPDGVFISLGGDLAAGELFVDQTATLSASGGFTIEPGATLRMTIGGATNGPIDVAGDLLLNGGALVIESVFGFDPPPGTVIHLITSGGLTGVFDIVTAPAFPDDRFYQAVLTPTGVDLVVATFGDFSDLGPEVNEDLPPTPRAVATADFNGDGFPDPAVAVSNPDDDLNGSVVILANAGNDSNGDWLGFTGMTTQIPVGRRPTGIASADFDLDGRPDFVVCNFLDDTVHVRLNTTPDGAPTFSFGPADIIDVEPGPIAVAAFPFDGDAFPDIVTANLSDDSASIILNQGITPGPGPRGGGSFGTPSRVPVGRRPIAADPADIDNDKDLDILITNDEAGSAVALRGTPLPGAVRMLVNVGAGGTVDGGGIPMGLHPLDTTIADLNNDGFPDVVTANSADGTLTVSLHGGSDPLDRGVIGAGLYLPSVPVPAGEFPRSVTNLDLNADGFLDLAVATEQGGSTLVRLLRNDFLEQGGQITLSDTQDIFPMGSPQVAGAADLNGDGTVDLLSLNHPPDPIRGAPQDGTSISVFINLAVGGALPSCVESMADNDTPETCQVVDAEECGGLITGKLEAREFPACEPDTYLVLFDKPGEMIRQDDNSSTEGNGWASAFFDVMAGTGLVANGDGTSSIRIGVTGRPDGFDGKFNGLFMNAPHRQLGGFCVTVTFKDGAGDPLEDAQLPDGSPIVNAQVYCDEFVTGAEAFRINYTLPVGTVKVDVVVDNVIGTQRVGGDVDYYCVENLVPYCEYCVVQVGGLTDDCLPTCTAIGWVDKEGEPILVAEGGGLIPEYTTLCPVVADANGRATIVVSGAGDLDFDGLLDALVRAPAQCPETPPFHEKIGCYTLIFEVVTPHGDDPGDGQSGDEMAAMEQALTHGDINMDGVTNTSDLGLLLNHYGWSAP